MTGWPVPAQYPITTAYGKRGSYWSCDEDSSGDGIHTGCDFACPIGTPLYATVAGEVRHRSYGSAFGSKQFAISPDPGQPFEDGEVFYAHCSERLADGTRVEVGDQVGRAGAEGNVSGPHLHYEYHPSSKGSWGCSLHADPAPTLEQRAPLPAGDVYLSELVYGQRDSDSVARLQEALNAHPLDGGQPLPTSGNYLDETDEEVRLCQAQHGYGSDPAGASSVGPKQADHLFAGTGHTVIDDRPIPEPEPPDPEPPEPADPVGVSTAYGMWKWYSGKDSDPWVLHPDGDWHDVPGFKQPVSGIQQESIESHFIYLRCILPEGRSADRVVEVRFIRSDGDATAYDHRTLGLKRDSYAFPSFHVESGSGLGGRWQAKVTGGTDPIQIETRYAKTYVEFQDTGAAPAAAESSVYLSTTPDLVRWAGRLALVALILRAIGRR